LEFKRNLLILKKLRATKIYSAGRGLKTTALVPNSETMRADKPFCIKLSMLFALRPGRILESQNSKKILG
jgi:hypothetical protein